MSVILGQLTNLSPVTYTVPTGGFVTTPFSVVDYHENLVGNIVTSEFTVLEGTPDYTAYFEIKVKVLGNASRVAVPMDVWLTVNGQRKLLAPSPLYSYDAIEPYTTVSGRIPMTTGLVVGDQVKLEIQNNSSYTNLTFGRCKFILSTGANYEGGTGPGNGDSHDRYTDEEAQDAVGSILEPTEDIYQNTFSVDSGLVTMDSDLLTADATVLGPIQDIYFTYDDLDNSITAALTSTGVVAGSYTLSNLTIDSKGRITFAENGVDQFVEGTTFDTGTGDLTLLRNEPPNLVQNLDGRYALQQIHTDKKEPNGFVDTYQHSDISFVDGTRTFTISPKVTSFSFYSTNIRYTKSSPESIIIDDIEGMWYIYFDALGVLQKTQTFNVDFIRQFGYAAAIYWDATNNKHIYLGDERHGITMSGTTHRYLHKTEGARWSEGLGLGDITIGNGSLDIHAQLSYEAGEILDEDLFHVSSAQALPAPMNFFYKSGVSNWRRIDSTGFVVTTTGSGRAAWNNVTTGVLTEVSNNTFVLMHAFATNDAAQPMVWIVGQGEYPTLSQARAAADIEIWNIYTEGLPFEEFVAIGTIICQTGNYANTVKTKIVTTEDGYEWIDWRIIKGIGSGSSTGTTDHGLLAGLSDDDHTQYLNETRHDALAADNPHSVTFTQAVSADAGTDITAAEAETLTDGSNADSLHVHAGGSSLWTEDAVNKWLEPTTDTYGIWLNDNDESDTTAGIIYKSGSRFIHTYHLTTYSGGATLGGNLFIGKDSGNFSMGSATSAEDGQQQLGIGDNTLNAQTTGHSNVAIGVNAMSLTATGFSNVSIGVNSLGLATNPSNNIAIGANTMLNATNAAYNIAIGSAALENISYASRNIAIGDNALNAITTQGTNVAIGDGSLESSTASFNVGVGYQSLRFSTTGSYNLAVGGGAMYRNETGGTNVAIGANAMYANVSGGENVAIGFNALYGGTDVSKCIAIGRDALQSTTADYNVGIGMNSIRSATGQGNIGIGYSALYTTGAGQHNVGIGYFAMQYLNGGRDNIGIGRYSLRDNVTSNYNIAVGTYALYDSTGEENVGIGNWALGSMKAVSQHNTALGHAAGRYVGAGTTKLLSVEKSIYIGYDSRSGHDIVSNEVVIGNATIGNGTDTVTIGNSSTTDNYLYGDLTVGSVKYTGTDGTAGYALVTDGLGSTSWAAVGGVTINDNTANNILTASGTANEIDGEPTFSYSAGIALIETANTDAIFYLYSGKTAAAERTSQIIMGGADSGTYPTVLTELGQIKFVDTKNQYTAGMIEVVAGNSAGATSMPGIMNFYTQASGGISPATAIRGIEFSEGTQLSINPDSDANLNFSLYSSSELAIQVYSQYDSMNLMMSSSILSNNINIGGALGFEGANIIATATLGALPIYEYAGGSAGTINLPTKSTAPRRTYFVINRSAYALTIASGDNINGSSNSAVIPSLKGVFIHSTSDATFGWYMGEWAAPAQP